MKHLLSLLALMLCTLAGAAQPLPEGFPSTPVDNEGDICASLSFSPYTTARFEMKRVLPTGRTLASKGRFEFRQGVGMMWLTQSPVVNAMIIGPNDMALYDAKGRLLRRNDFFKSPAGRQMSAYLSGFSGESFTRLSRIFVLTYSRQDELLHLGFVPKRSMDSFDWMWVQVRGGNLETVEYAAETRGRTTVKFSEVRNADTLPDKPFEIKG